MFIYKRIDVDGIRIIYLQLFHHVQAAVWKKDHDSRLYANQETDLMEMSADTQCIEMSGTDYNAARSPRY